ncbi:MAG: PilX N-terminal domain-containing pilus assembly protein [Pseudomonadota bacterium]
MLYQGEPDIERYRKKQRGFSLATTLVLLVILMGLGLAASQVVLLSERTSRFQRDSQIAFQAAEAALLDAEFDIRGPNVHANQRGDLFTGHMNDAQSFTGGCGTGLYAGLCLPSTNPVWYSVDFTDEAATNTARLGQFTGRSFPAGAGNLRSAMLPRYIIEIIPDLQPGSDVADSRALYRITAVGFGPHKKTQSVLQTVFRKD